MIARSKNVLLLHVKISNSTTTATSLNTKRNEEHEERKKKRKNECFYPEFIIVTFIHCKTQKMDFYKTFNQNGVKLFAFTLKFSFMK